MKTKPPTTITVDVSVTLSIDGPKGIIGDDIYFSEHDGVKISGLAQAPIGSLPKGAKIESNGRDEAWISHWNDEALAALDGRTFDIRFTQTFDGEENWIEDSATIID